MLTVELCQLCASGDVVGVQILLDGGADPNSRDYDDRTLLHIAAMNGRLAVINLLLEYGADHMLQDREGKTPLELAEEFAHADIAKVLLGKYESGEVLPDSFSANPLVSDTSPMSPNAPDFSSVPQPMVGSLIVIMVGLPARGKTYVAQQIRRYFQWNGLTCNIFSHQVYRKRVEKELLREGGSGAPVPSTADIEARVSAIIAKEMTRFIVQTGGVAILDGTQSTTARRSALLRALKSTHHIQPNRVIFVEVVNNDKSVIHNNILRARDLFANAPENFVQQYYSVLEQHEAVYKTLNPLSDSDLSYIRIEDNKNYSLNMISGWMPSRLAYMLHNLSHTPANLYLSRPGEYVDMLCGRIGGNSRLTERGKAYSAALFEYFKAEMPPHASLNVMTSCAKRATQTIHYFAEESSKLYGQPAVDHANSDTDLNCHVSYFPTLDDINHGDCEGMLLSDVRKTMPNTLHSMCADPYYTAWPNGECIHQVFNARLEPHIHDIQASSAPVLVVSHLHLLQGLLSFFITDEDKVVAPQNAYQIDVPFESVIKIGLVGMKRTAEIIDLSKHVNQVLERTNRDVTPSAKEQDLDYNAFRRYDKKPDA
ncbi:6-phosphofructo-2-kinase [Strigomonas culicis]|nr:6-phosphofructo-2-kinase [Strigomonas culicis]|eukprot:EPY24792.1 6-phosphofructo-2-kinase [Strigomonas culicis]